MMTIPITIGLHRPVLTPKYEWTAIKKDDIVHHVAAPVGAGEPDRHYVALIAGDP
jgi:hypothetical protein